MNYHLRMAAPTDRRTLDRLALREPARVVRIEPPRHAPEWRPWLESLGFLPGEAVAIVARGRPGNEPLAIRVGDSTFALRRAEAACIEVEDPAR